MGDAEEFEGPPLQRGGGGGHGERWGVVGGLDVVGADGGQVGEQAGEAVHRGVLGGAFTGGFGQRFIGALSCGHRVGAFGGGGGGWAFGGKGGFAGGGGGGSRGGCTSGSGGGGGFGGGGGGGGGGGAATNAIIAGAVGRASNAINGMMMSAAMIAV